MQTKNPKRVTVQVASQNMATDYPQSQLFTSGIEAPQKEITSTLSLQSTSYVKHNNEDGIVSGSDSQVRESIIHVETSHLVNSRIETAPVSTTGTVGTEDLNPGSVSQANQETEISNESHLFE